MSQFIETDCGIKIPVGLYSKFGVVTLFPKEDYLLFEKVKRFIINLDITCRREWFEYCKSGTKPDNIPFNPDIFYKDKGWISWGDFLGTGYIATFNRKFLSFKEARKFVRKLGLKNITEWRKYCKSGKRPDNIPSNPNQEYNDKGWIGIGDWLGNGYLDPKYRKYLSFSKTKKFVKNLKLNGRNKWREYYKSGKRPNDIPSYPEKIYKGKGWISWGDFLGTGNIYTQNVEFLSFEKAKEFARNLNFKTAQEWKDYAKSDRRPNNIPSNLHRAYKDKGWTSWPDFLGTNK